MVSEMTEVTARPLEEIGEGMTEEMSLGVFHKNSR